MNTRMRRAAFAVAAGAMAVSLAACGSAEESGDKSDSTKSAAKGDNIKVGLLLPENQTARYEKFDKPLIEKKVKEPHERQGRGRLRQRQAGRHHAVPAGRHDDHQQGGRADRGRGGLQGHRQRREEGQGQPASPSSRTTASPRARSTPTPPSTTKRSAASRARRSWRPWATRPSPPRRSS